MRLIIQIPCLNEEKTLPLVLRDIPKTIQGISSIETVIIDDGSTDKTRDVAKKYGATVLKHNKNKGLGESFKRGLKYALKQNVDILINTDGDNQYPSYQIPKLISTMQKTNADLVIGNREPWKVEHFSPLKKVFQFFGSFVVRGLTQSKVEDTVSGFRAYNREAMYHLHITTKFSYVLDSIMQLSKKNLKIVSVKIPTNKPTRKSRLFTNMFQHMQKSGVNILRLYAIYEPFKIFFISSVLFATPGTLLIMRFLYFYAQGLGDGYVQSLIIASVMVITAVLLFVLGIIGELLKTNRMLIEETYTVVKRIENERRR